MTIDLRYSKQNMAAAIVFFRFLIFSSQVSSVFCIKSNHYLRSVSLQFTDAGSLTWSNFCESTKMKYADDFNWSPLPKFPTKNKWVACVSNDYSTLSYWLTFLQKKIISPCVAIIDFKLTFFLNYKFIFQLENELNVFFIFFMSRVAF